MPASYRTLSDGQWNRRIKKAWALAAPCRLCPHHCDVDRTQGQRGRCGIGNKARVASFGAHPGEERPLSGRFGSGTIFFAGCNLSCVYCQNFDISQQATGDRVSAQTLADLMLQLQDRRCHNINLVSPTHVIPLILEGLYQAASDGLTLPIVYNSGGYDSVEALTLLDGIIDIYLPDMKYQDPEIARELSDAPNYPKMNRQALREMHRQVGDLEVDDAGIAVRGLLVRHLVLPHDLSQTGSAMAFLANTLSRDTAVNIMGQYRPEYQARTFDQLSRPVSTKEIRRAREQAQAEGLHRIHF